MNCMKITVFMATLLFLSLTAGSCYKPEKTAQKKYSREMINLGGQLVNEGKCNFCHSPTIDTEEGSIYDPERILSGHPEESQIPNIPNVPVGSQQWLEFLSNLESTVWAGPWGLSFAANITPDVDTGIGSWSEKNFVNMMKTGKHAGIGRTIMQPMPWDDYRELSDRDLLSIYAYLRTIEPVHNEVPEPIHLEDK